MYLTITSKNVRLTTTELLTRKKTEEQKSKELKMKREGEER